MKVKFVLIISIFYLSFSGAEEFQNKTSILEYDKVLHFTAGYIISDAVFVLQRSGNILLPFLVPAAAGAGKELSDSYFDWKDFACTGLGAVTRISLSLSGKEEFHLGSFTLEYENMMDFTAGYLIAELVFARQRSDDVFLPVLLSAAAGAVKELLEEHFDWEDVGYTVLGAVTRYVLRASFKF